MNGAETPEVDVVITKDPRQNDAAHVEIVFHEEVPQNLMDAIEDAIIEETNKPGNFPFSLDDVTGWAQSRLDRWALGRNLRHRPGGWCFDAENPIPDLTPEDFRFKEPTP